MRTKKGVRPDRYAQLVKLYEQVGESRADGIIAEMFEAKEVRPDDFDLGRLFEACFGWHAFASCRADTKQLATDIMENAGAVTTAAFQNISGQVVYSAIQDAYDAEEFVFTKLIPEVQTNLNGEKIPGVNEIGDEAVIRNETDPYALAGVGEDWQTTPEPRDRGLIVPVTREAIFFDRTGLVLKRCSDVGRWLGVNVEKRAIDCVVDENATTHRYNWRTFGAQATYGNNSGTHTWDNLSASTALLDWTDLDACEQLLNEMTDPYTGEPIVVEAKHLVCTKSLTPIANYILSSTQLVQQTTGFATSGNLNRLEYPNPWANKYQVVTSRLLAARMATDTSWFLGDISKAFVRMVNWPLETTQAPPNSHEEFHRQIVQQFRANERSVFYTREPRAMIKATA